MLYRIEHLDSRAACAENPSGARSSGGMAGGGRKGAPCLGPLRSGETATLLDVDGPGMVRHIWITFPPEYPLAPRDLILRMYWNDADAPSVEAPMGDFFGLAHAYRRNLVNALFTVQNGKGYNCFAPMPFLRHARITVENDGDQDIRILFYQVDFTLGDRIEPDDGCFCAQFRRANPCPMHEDYTLLDGVRGAGQILGTVLGVRSRTRALGWWGEGEFKFYIDGERQPTICGTGVEDYAGFAWGLAEMQTPWQGCAVCDGELGLYSLYRMHVADPICFEKEIRITVQQIGCGSGASAKAYLGDDFARHQIAHRPPDSDMCYYDLSDDYCSVVYWYQTFPIAPFPPLPEREARRRDLMIERRVKQPGRDDL